MTSVHDELEQMTSRKNFLRSFQLNKYGGLSTSRQPTVRVHFFTGLAHFPHHSKEELSLKKQHRTPSVVTTNAPLLG
jgi:hypothetical protein